MVDEAGYWVNKSGEGERNVGLVNDLGCFMGLD